MRGGCLWRSPRAVTYPSSWTAAAIDIHNAAAGWNKALLDNAARPSGALVYGKKDGHLTAEQFARLKAELETSFQGARNAGRPLLLEGGLDWKPLSLSPKDMDFIEAKNAAAREIAVRAQHGFAMTVRRAADAARHSRRQHLFELPGGEPRVLAPGLAEGELEKGCCRW